MGADHLDATLLHYAASGGNLAIMQKLLDLGCDKDVLTKYGRSVLHYSAYGEGAEALVRSYVWHSMPGLYEWYTRLTSSAFSPE